MSGVDPAAARSIAPAVTPQRVERPVARERQGVAAETRGLLDVLTPEEREFFEEQAALGPLTYRARGAQSDSPLAPVGRRIDVRG